MTDRLVVPPIALQRACGRRRVDAPGARHGRPRGTGRPGRSSLAPVTGRFGRISVFLFTLHGVQQPALAGVLCYGRSRDDAVARIQALALRVIAERLEHGDVPPELVTVCSAPCPLRRREPLDGDVGDPSLRADHEQ